MRRSPLVEKQGEAGLTTAELLIIIVVCAAIAIIVVAFMV